MSLPTRPARGESVAATDSGAAIAFGRNLRGQTNVPALADGLTHTAVAAGEEHTVLLRSAGIGALGVTGRELGSGLEAAAALLALGTALLVVGSRRARTRRA